MVEESGVQTADRRASSNSQAKSPKRRLSKCCSFRPKSTLWSKSLVFKLQIDELQAIPRRMKAVMRTECLTTKTRSCNRRDISMDDDESQALSYSYGGDYRYHNEYDDAEEEEEEDQRQRYAYRQYGEEEDQRQYENKLD